MQLYHGSPELFDAFDLSKAGEGTGVKFGFGVYLTESEDSAVHYSQPRNLEADTPSHYLYTIEIPDLTADNHLVSALPVAATVVHWIKEYYPHYLGINRYPAAKCTLVGKAKDEMVGPNLLGQFLMELRDTDKLDYSLPADALDFVEYLK